MQILGYIPARGGSKGVPGKNKKILGKLPLISYTIKAAQHSKLLSEIFVSTDDIEISSIAQSHGINVPRLRPAELAQDNSPIVPVIQNDIAYLENSGKYFDYIAILQPTNPFKAVSLIDTCIVEILQAGADTLFSTTDVPEKYNPHWTFELNEEGFLKLSTLEKAIITRRQLLPKAVIREGSIYIFKRNLLDQHTIYGPRIIGHSIDSHDTVNIDTPDDWNEAEMKLAEFLSRNKEYNL
jgi:CMP-N,N'-diacetyllegionaminic acid synthase